MQLQIDYAESQDHRPESVSPNVMINSIKFDGFAKIQAKLSSVTSKVPNAGPSAITAPNGISRSVRKPGSLENKPLYSARMSSLK